jgi:hypothetical protein
MGWLWHIRVMRKCVFIAIAAFSAGCSRADVETLGRIGSRVEKKIDFVWNSENNRRLMKSLPLLQQPEGAAPGEDHDGGRAVPPRLSVE